ncbi:MAG TPA: DUF1850 domain-containing protein [Chloroflexota bacterium]|nr:DUF1850 domain-containing protein [Chloroflexota bacterium]
MWPTRAVRIVDETNGRQLACVAARAGTELRVAYVHSIYRQPASEEFVVRDDALELTRLRSPSLPVMEYYARREPIQQDVAGYTIEVAPERHQSLPVLVSRLGERTVHYDGRVWPLYELAADGDRVRVSVGPRPRICTLWPSRR